jgi:hypothetical protein
MDCFFHNSEVTESRAGNMNKGRRAFLLFASGTGAAFLEDWFFGTKVVAGRPEHFLPEEKRLIEQYYHSGKKPKAKGLPPGLAKRGGNLPPGLQKKLEKNGELPPGLQKRLEPLPDDLNRQLPALPEYWERVIVEHDVILLDRRTNRILDIIENVIALATGQ